MSTPCTTCQPNPTCTEGLDRYSLQEDLYHFVIECPPGFNCGGLGIITLTCCDGTEYSVNIEESISAATRTLIINQMVQQCIQRHAFCGDTSVDGDPDDPDDPVVLYYSRAKNCSVTCPDGSVFTYYLRAGRYIGFNQAEIDQAAQTEACRQARLHKLCLSELPDFCCEDVAYSQRIRVSGAGASNIHYWYLLNGTLPHGLEMNGFPLIAGWVPGRSVLISGTPDTPGTATFTVRVVAPDHCYMDKTYTICTVGISPNTLPNAAPSVPYSQTLSTTACLTGTLTWTISDGSLPAGLTLDPSTGVISGTPTGMVGVDDFTVTVESSTGTSCSKDYSITLAAPYFAYFKLDEASAATTLVDSVAGYDLGISAGTTVSIPGKISTAVQIGNYVVTRWLNGPDAHWVFSGDFTVRFWIRPAFDGGNNQILWSGNQWQVWYMPGFNNPGQVALEFLVETDPGSAFVDTTDLTLGAWNHVILWFEQGVGCGARINNGADILNASVDPIQAYATLDLNLRGWNDMPAVGMDEIAIWNRKLTTAEMIADWNGGNGVTY